MTLSTRKKVIVSGCYDLLHSGHVAFFQEAASYGDLYVALGSDKTIYGIKGRPPVNDEAERLFMVKSIGCVTDAFVSRGSGMLDFLEELDELAPEVFVVNRGGDLPEKRHLCEERGIQYIVLERVPHPGLAARSTTDLRRVTTMPYRIDLAGGWLDQPWVSGEHPGPVITISIEPTVDFNERSGMASSTRKTAMELWGPRLPAGDPETLAKILFAVDNPPGTQEVSGSQDTIGIVFPGLAASHYRGEYWPERIETVQDEDVLSFIERSLYLVPLEPRESGFSVLDNTRITRDGARNLADAALGCLDAALAKDPIAFGRYIRAGFEAQIAMFPNMVNQAMLDQIEAQRKSVLGWKISGAGGGGYLILVADSPIADALRIVIRRD